MTSRFGAAVDDGVLTEQLRATVTDTIIDALAEFACSAELKFCVAELKLRPTRNTTKHAHARRALEDMLGSIVETIGDLNNVLSDKPN